MGRGVSKDMYEELEKLSREELMELVVNCIKEQAYEPYKCDLFKK